MRLTPLDIRKQEFTRAFRGYDPDEVLAFLQMLSSQWEDLLDENRRRDEKIRDLENKMAHYEKVEEALQEALQTARETSRDALQNAENKAKLIIDSAEKRAQEITRDADRDLHQVKRDAATLSGKRSEIVTRLRAFLMSEMELLAHFEGDDPIGFIKLLPAEERPPQRMAADAPPALRVTSEDEEGEFHDMVPSSDALHPRVTYGQTEDDIEPDEAHQAPAAESNTSGAPARSRDDEFLSIPEEHAAGSGDLAERTVDDEHGPEPSADNEDSVGNRGWTTRTVVSRPSEYTPPPAGEADDTEDSGAKTGTRSRASSEEIEKIRRILSGLD